MSDSKPIAREDSALNILPKKYIQFKVVSLTLAFFGVFGTMQIFGWPLLKYWGVKGHTNFADLNSVLGSADCFRKIGFEIYTYPIGHECAYNYGSWLMRSINSLGLKEDYTSILGWLFILGMAVLFAYVLANSNLRTIDVLFAIVVFVSPPIMLLLERGNFDTLIIFLIVVGAKFAAEKRINLSIFVIFASFLYKFYTAGLVLLLSFISQRFAAFIFWMVAFGIGLFQVVNDFQRGPGFINTERISFGSPIFGIYLKYVGLNIPYVLSLIIGLFLLFIGLFLFALDKSPTSKFFAELKAVEPKERTLDYVFFFFITVHVTCYILGMNFDYRLIMIAIANFILIAQFGLSAKSKLIIRILTVAIMWTSFNSGFLQPVGDLLIGIVTIHYIYFAWWYVINSNRGVSMRQSLLKLSRKFP